MNNMIFQYFIFILILNILLLQCSAPVQPKKESHKKKQNKIMKSRQNINQERLYIIYQNDWHS